MRDDAAPGPLTPASAPKAPGRLGREDARTFRHRDTIIVGMPIYEYRCGACGKRSSSLLASYSSPDPACPHCGKAELKRLVSTFATVRSGDGGDDFGGDDDFDGGHSHDDDMGGDDFGGGFDGGDDDY
jgi:putative FmdB family regulatory protein